MIIVLLFTSPAVISFTTKTSARVNSVSSVISAVLTANSKSAGVPGWVPGVYVLSIWIVWEVLLTSASISFV